jgi:membrane protein
VEISESFFPKLLRRSVFRLRRLYFQVSEYTFLKFSLALWHKAGRDDISTLAAGIAYYALLSLFPLMLGMLAIFGLFLPSESVQDQLARLLSQYLPGSLAIFEGSIKDIVRWRSALGIVSLLGLLWSGSGVFSVTIKAINKAWNIRYEHPFYIKKPRELGMLVVAGILFLLSLGTSTFLTYIGSFNLPFSGVIINIATAAIALFFSLLVFMLIQKISPTVLLSWRHIWPGAVLSTVLFEIAKTLFVLYLNHFNNYDKIYGPISSVIALLVWIYYSSFILLLGAEFNAILFRLRRYGKDFADPDIDEKFKTD